MIYSSWSIECDRLILVIMGHFLPFHLPLKNPKNQNFEKMKTTSWDVIILHMCTKNHNHMMTDIIFCHLGPFLPFYLTISTANKDWSMVNYHQSSAFDHPYLSCNDHCNQWLFLEIFHYFFLEILLNDLELVSLEFKHLYKTNRTSLFSFYVHLMFCLLTCCFVIILCINLFILFHCM